MNNKQPLVSVIIPTYNHAQFIAKAIESVLAQTYRNVELVVVDNYSEDNTKEEVNSFQNNQIKYYRYRNNGIIAASRNFGISKSKGDIIAFLDSDDEWNRDKLENQVKHLYFEGVSCVSSNFTLIGRATLWRDPLKFREGELYRDYSYNHILLKNPVINSSAIILKKNLIKLKGLDENPTFIAIEDWDLWLRASKIGKVRVIAEKLVKYRIHMNNIRDKREVHLRSLTLFQKHQELGHLDDKLLNTAIGNRYLLLGKAFLNANDWMGINYYGRALISSKGFHNKIRAVVGVLLFLFPKKLRQRVIVILHHLSRLIQKKIYYPN